VLAVKHKITKVRHNIGETVHRNVFSVISHCAPAPLLQGSVVVVDIVHQGAPRCAFSVFAVCPNPCLLSRQVTVAPTNPAQHFNLQAPKVRGVGRQRTVTAFPTATSMASRPPTTRDPESLISRLSWRPEEEDIPFVWARLAGLTDGMTLQQVAIFEIPRPSAPTFLPQRIPSTFRGPIGRLPAEIFDQIIGHLDLKSCTRLARVSFQCRELVLSQRDYQNSIALHWRAALATAVTGFQTSVSNIHQALRSTTCAACPNYGPYLFLPTADRCCWGCFRGLEAFRFPQNSYDPRPGGPAQPWQVGQAVDRFNQLWRQKALAGELDSPDHPWRQKMLISYPTLPIETPFIRVFNGAMLLHNPKRPDLAFPDRGGFICKGCVYLQAMHCGSLDSFFDDLSWHVIRDAGHVANGLLMPLRMRARSYEEFMEHIDECYGAEKMAPDLVPGQRSGRAGD